MILFQVRDLAAKSCGEPHVAPSWEIAKASLGAMLAKTPDLAERAHAITIEQICEWDPQVGVIVTPDLFKAELIYSTGDVCLAEFLSACRKEEDQKQAEADDSSLDGLREKVHSVLRQQAAGEEEHGDE